MTPVVRDGELLLVAAEGVLDIVLWVAALLTAEAPLAGRVARATGHLVQHNWAAASSQLQTFG